MGLGKGAFRRRRFTQRIPQCIPQCIPLNNQGKGTYAHGHIRRLKLEKIQILRRRKAFKVPEILLTLIRETLSTAENAVV